jgi:hypothetical protein
MTPAASMILDLGSIFNLDLGRATRPCEGV